MKIQRAVIPTASLLLLANGAWADVVNPDSIIIDFALLALLGIGIIAVAFGAWLLLKRFLKKGGKK